jgi:hypothetical protein
MGRPGAAIAAAACAALFTVSLIAIGARADDNVMMPAMPERSFLKPELPLEPQYVPGTDEKFPRLRYADGQISLNDRCPVRHVKLNPKMAPVYVNGKPIGFC